MTSVLKPPVPSDDTNASTCVWERAETTRGSLQQNYAGSRFNAFAKPPEDLTMLLNSVVQRGPRDWASFVFH